MQIKHGTIALVAAIGLCVGTTGGAAVAGERGGLGRYASEEPLDADLAFRTSMMTARDGKLVVRFDMPPGYYLYRNKLSISAKGAMKIKSIAAPPGLSKQDEFLGAVNIYRDTVMVVVDRTNATTPGELVVKYQGCAENLICYPPMTRVFQVPAGSACPAKGQNDRHSKAC